MYELIDKEGRVAPIVLKAARQVALISDTQREWATGKRLSALGPGELPCRSRRCPIAYVVEASYSCSLTPRVNAQASPRFRPMGHRFTQMILDYTLTGFLSQKLL